MSDQITVSGEYGPAVVARMLPDDRGFDLRMPDGGALSCVLSANAIETPAAPTLTAIAVVAGRVLTLTRTGLTGSPAPSLTPSLTVGGNTVAMTVVTPGQVWTYTFGPSVEDLDYVGALTAANGVAPPATFSFSGTVAANLAAPTVSVAFALADYAAGDIITAADIVPTISAAGLPALELSALTRILVVNGSPVALPYTAVEGASIVARVTWTHPATVGVQVANSAPEIVAPFVQLDLATTSDGELEATGTGTFSAEILAPARLIGGPFITDQSDQANGAAISFEAGEIGPIGLVKPVVTRVSGSADVVGEVYRATKGVWLYDADDIATLEVEGQWWLNGTPIPGATERETVHEEPGVYEWVETVTGAGETRTMTSNPITIEALPGLTISSRPDGIVFGGPGSILIEGRVDGLKAE